MPYLYNKPYIIYILQKVFLYLDSIVFILYHAYINYLIIVNFFTCHFPWPLEAQHIGVVQHGRYLLSLGWSKGKRAHKIAVQNLD